MITFQMQFERLVRLALARSFEQGGIGPVLPIHLVDGTPKAEKNIQLRDGFGLTFLGGDIIFPSARPVEGSFYAGQGEVADYKLRAVMKSAGLHLNFIFVVGSDRQFVDDTTETLTVIDPKRSSIRVLLSISSFADALELSLLEIEGVDIINNLILAA